MAKLFRSGQRAGQPDANAGAIFIRCLGILAGSVLIVRLRLAVVAKHGRKIRLADVAAAPLDSSEPAGKT